MPSSATLTAFYTFTTGSAKSGEVNANFNAFRGHILPVDGSLSASALTESYDLGSSEYHWGGIYSQALDISVTTTSAMIMQGLSAGAIDFKKNGTTMFSILTEGFVGINATPSALFTTASAGNVAGSSILSSTLTSSGAIAGSTLTITTVGRRVAIGLVAGLNSANNYLECGAQTSSAGNSSYAISIVRDGATLPALTARTLGKVHQWPGAAFFMIDVPGAGLHTYSLTVVSLTANHFICPNQCRLVAWEF